MTICVLFVCQCASKRATAEAKRGEEDGFQLHGMNPRAFFDTVCSHPGQFGLNRGKKGRFRGKGGTMDFNKVGAILVVYTNLPFCFFFWRGILTLRKIY